MIDILLLRVLALYHQGPYLGNCTKHDDSYPEIDKKLALVLRSLFVLEALAFLAITIYTYDIAECELRSDPIPAL